MSIEVCMYSLDVVEFLHVGGNNAKTQFPFCQGLSFCQTLA